FGKLYLVFVFNTLCEGKVFLRIFIIIDRKKVVALRGGQVQFYLLFCPFQIGFGLVQCNFCSLGSRTALPTAENRNVQTNAQKRGLIPSLIAVEETEILTIGRSAIIYKGGKSWQRLAFFQTVFKIALLHKVVSNFIIYVVFNIE